MKGVGTQRELARAIKDRIGGYDAGIERGQSGDRLKVEPGG